MPSQYSIRPASKQDQKAINRLIREGGINPLGTHWSRFLVAEEEAGDIIGCGQVKAHRDGSHELASLAVTRAWRGRGVAAAIMKELQQAYGSPLWLTCMDRLVPYYERFAFERIESPQQNPQQVPVYFRRASRFFNLYLALTRGEGQLAVMVWVGTEK